MPSLDVLKQPPAAQVIDPRALPAVEVPGLYVHVPFCFHKCHYCDFYSITRQTPERMNHYVALTLRELDHWLDARVQSFRPQTIFFGGGTPSLLPFETMQTFLEGLRARLDLSALNEWTIEVNPATTDLGYLQMLRSLGVTRISMGAQSFDVDELKILERHHNPLDVDRSVSLARDAGFQRINIDLIYAIPGQTQEKWLASLRRAMDLKLTHYSCYNLTYEPNTPMAVKQRLGRIQEVEESVELQMLRGCRSLLAEHGILPYEISNFAAPGEACRHNLLYWLGNNYLGIGPSAASHIEGVRFKNRPHLGEWEAAITRGILQTVEVETLSREQREGEFMMLRLRLAQGVSVSDFEAKFGVRLHERFGRELDTLAKHGLLDVSDHIRLTDTGLPVADAIAAEFL